MYEARVDGPATDPVEWLDGSSWGGLEELRDGLRGHLGRRCADEHELEDAVQETLLRAARYRGLHEVQCLRGWVLSIGRNVVSDGRRRRLRAGQPTRETAAFEELAEQVAEPEPQEEGVRCAGSWFELEAARALVVQVLGRLQGQDHALLWGFYGRALALENAARQAGVPPHLARVRLYRARRKLRAALTREVSMRRHLGLAS